MLCFGESVLLLEFLCHCINDAVDITATLWGAVPLGNLHVFVDGDRNGNLWETEQFCHCNLHDDDIHVGKAVELPVLDALADEGAVVLIIHDGATEQTNGELLVLDVLVFGHEFLVGSIDGVESLDGLEHEGVNHFAVIVPIETLLLEDVVNTFILHDDVLVEFAPQFAIIGIGHLLSCLYHVNGKWEVFYFDERGNKQMLRKCSSETSACEFIHHELALLMLTKEAVIFSQTPVLLPQTLESIGKVDIVEVATHVWFDSIIGQEESLPEDIATIIFELEKLEDKRYKIRFGGSKKIIISGEDVDFSIDYRPYHDWMLVRSEKNELEFEEEYSDIINKCKNGKGNASYRNFFIGRTFCVGSPSRIHIVP